MIKKLLLSLVMIFMLFSACGEYPVGPPEKRFTVTYSINGGSGSMPSSQTVKAGNDVYLPNGNYFSRSGFTFGGWNTNSSGTGTNYTAGSSFTPTSDTTLFARWLYTVTYDRNGGSGTTPSVQTGGSGSSVILASGSGLTRSGFVFGGWNTNSSGTGTSYNAGSSFTLSSSITLYVRWVTGVDGGTLSYGGQNYRTVIIGGKRWMAENLNYSGSGGNVGVCNNGSLSNCNTYGRLYTWAEAMNIGSTFNTSTYYSGSSSNVQHQGICPSGWRLPNDNDWTALTTAVGSNAGTKLKSTSGWNSGGNGTDEFGFSALPGGYHDWSRSYIGGYNGYWWSATEYDATEASNRVMSIQFSTVGSLSTSLVKRHAFSVRCLQD